jgi:hypothetical protein
VQPRQRYFGVDGTGRIRAWRMMPFSLGQEYRWRR